MSSLSFITRVDPQSGKPTPPDGKRKVFLSYRHADEAQRPLCERLANYILERFDVAVWFDNQLTAGESYDAEIERAIRESDVFIPVLSQDVLSSAYIWEREIPLAKKQQVAVMPIVAGLDTADIAKVEQYVGRVHMPVWFAGQTTAVPTFHTDALEQFYKGLAIGIANKDLLDQARLFYEQGRHAVSLRHLTAEQVFAKAYGCFYGMDPAHDASVGVRLMDSILQTYGLDADFEQLQEQVALELLKHFYRTDQPELFISYTKVALSRSYQTVWALLADVYEKQWHAERLCEELSLSMALMHHFRRQAGMLFDEETIAAQLKEAEPKARLSFDEEPPSAVPPVGMLRFDGHTAYFRRLTVNDAEVHLVVDHRVIASFDAPRFNVDAACVFSAYDADHRLLIVMHSDFDHYGPETIFTCTYFRIDEDGVRCCRVYSDWLRGRRVLPYTPYVLG